MDSVVCKGKESIAVVQGLKKGYSVEEKELNQTKFRPACLCLEKQSFTQLCNMARLGNSQIG